MDIFLKAKKSSLKDFLQTYNNSLLQKKTSIQHGGYGLLHSAVSGKNTPLVKFLIEEGIDVNQRDKNQQTALHYAVQVYGDKITKTDIDIVKLLLESDCDINITDIFGNSSLWTACHFSKGIGYQIVEVLMKYSPDIRHKNKVNKSPLDLSRERGYKKLENILVNK